MKCGVGAAPKNNTNKYTNALKYIKYDKQAQRHVEGSRVAERRARRETGSCNQRSLWPRPRTANQSGVNETDRILRRWPGLTRRARPRSSVWRAVLELFSSCNTLRGCRGAVRQTGQNYLLHLTSFLFSSVNRNHFNVRLSVRPELKTVQP